MRRSEDFSATCRAAVLAYEPNSSAWTHLVQTRLRELASVFADAYGRNDRGGALHQSRIVHALPWIFAVEDEQGSFVAASYVFRGGRRAASGVVAKHQGHGHYSQMVKHSLEFVPAQFTELRPHQHRQRHSLNAAGFTAQNDWEQVASLLGPLLVPLVHDVSHVDGELHYERLSFDGGEKREFVLLQRGLPAPIVQSTPYYPRSVP